MDQDTSSFVGSADYQVDADEFKKRRLINLFIRQAERRTFILKFRAFKKWHDKYPLVMKCIELTRQLQERSMMLESVRSSYLKDVVSVKSQLSCLSKLAEETITQYVSRRKIEDSLTDLHTVPSADLRQIISKAEETIAADSSSALVRDALIDCGLVDPAKLRAYNPWEKSRSYRRLLRAQRGPSYDYPDTGGNSFELAAPRDYRMFVRYCQHCIGIVQFVKDWNNEVEKNMRFRAEYGKIDSMIDELKRVINSLQDTIIEKETSLIHLRTKCAELEKAKEWFNKWSFQKEEEERKALMDEKHRRLVDQLHLVEEDREALRHHLISRHQESMSKVTTQLVDLQRQLRKIAEEREQEALARLSLAEDLQRMMQARANMKGEIDKLKSLQSQDLSERDMLSNKLAKADQVAEELEKELSKLQREFDHHKSVSSHTIINLQSEIADLSKRLEKKDNDLDDLRADLRTKKSENANYAIEIASLQQQLAQTQFRLDRALNSKSAHNGELLEEPDLPATKKPSVVFVKYPLKVVAIAIRALMKFRYFLETKDPSRLGSLGDRIQLCQAYKEQVRLKGEMQKKASTIMAQETDLSMLRRMKGNMEQQLTGANKTIDKQKEDIKGYQGKVDGLNKLIVDISKEKDRLSMELQSRSTARANSLAPVIRRAKVFANLQRSLSKQLAKSAFDVRALVHTLEIEDQLKRLEEEKQQVLQWTQQTQQFAASLFTDNSNSSSPSSVKRRQSSMIAVKAATTLRRSVLTRKPPSADSSVLFSPTAVDRSSVLADGGMVDMQAAIAAAVAAANDPRSTAAVISNDSTLLSPSKPVPMPRNWPEFVRKKGRQWILWMRECLPEYIAYFDRLDAVEEDNLRYWLLGDPLLPGHILQEHQKRLWSSSGITRSSQPAQTLNSSVRQSMVMTPGFVMTSAPDYDISLEEVSNKLRWDGITKNNTPFSTSIAISLKKKAKLEMLLTNEKPQWNVRTMYVQDVKHTEALCRQQEKDLQQLDTYIYQLRQQYNQLLQRVQQLEEEKRDLLQRTPMKATRRSNTNEPVITYGMNGNNETRAKLRQMKSSFMHLIDKNDMNAYLNKVIETIDQAKQEVQQEKEEEYEENGVVADGGEGDDPTMTISPTRRMTKSRSRSMMRKAMGSFRGSVNAGVSSFSQPADTINQESDKQSAIAAVAMNLNKAAQPAVIEEEENEHEDDDQHHGTASANNDATVKEEDSSAPVIIPESDAAISAAVSRVVAAVRRTSSVSTKTSLASASKAIPTPILASTPMIAPLSTVVVQQNISSTAPSAVNVTSTTVGMTKAAMPSIATPAIESNRPPNSSIHVPPPVTVVSPNVTAKEFLPSEKSATQALSPSANKSTPMSPISARINKPERSLLQQATSSFSLDNLANSMSAPAPEPLKPSDIIRQAKQEKLFSATYTANSNNPLGSVGDAKEEKGEDDYDYDEEEEEDIHLFEDEPDDDIEDELEIAKQEALAMLKRDNLLRVELDALKVDREQLQQTYDAFKRDAYTEKRKLNDEIDELVQQLATLSAAYEMQQEENEKLREIVQDSYHHYDTEIATKLAELETKKNTFFAEQRRTKEKRDVATQIACSVCTIQEYGLYDAPSEVAVVHPASANAFPLSSSTGERSAGARSSNCCAHHNHAFDKGENTVPEVQITLTNALQGSALVLAPKVKEKGINTSTTTHVANNNNNGSIHDESSDLAAEIVQVFRHNPKSSYQILYGGDVESIDCYDQTDIENVPQNGKNSNSSPNGNSKKQENKNNPKLKKIAFASSSHLPIDTGFTERIISVLNHKGIPYPHMTLQQSQLYPHVLDDYNEASNVSQNDNTNIGFRMPMTTMDKSANLNSLYRLQEAPFQSADKRMDIFADNSSINIHSNSSTNNASSHHGLIVTSTANNSFSTANNSFSTSATAFQGPTTTVHIPIQQQRLSVSFPRTSGELPGTSAFNSHIMYDDDEVDIEDMASAPGVQVTPQQQQKILDKNRHMLQYAKQLLRSSHSGNNYDLTSSRPSSAKQTATGTMDTSNGLKQQQRPLSAAAAVRQKLEHFSSQKMVKGTDATHSRPKTAVVSTSTLLDNTIRSNSNYFHNMDVFHVANHVPNNTQDAAELLSSAISGQPLRPVSPSLLQQQQQQQQLNMTINNNTTKFSKLKQIPRAQSTTALPAASSRNGAVLLSHSKSTKSINNISNTITSDNASSRKSVNEASQEAQFRARTDANSAAFLQARHWAPRVNDNILGS